MSVASRHGQRVDVMVVGAGPAGAMAAHACATRGLRTLLVERSPLPRDKVCGCCLTPAGADALARSGLGTVLHDAGTLTTLRLMHAGSQARLALPAYRVLSRRELDVRLVEAASRAGAVVRTRTSAVVHADSSVTLTSEGGSERCVPACVVVADGLAGASLREHGAFAWRVHEASHMGLGVTLAASPIAIAPDELLMVVAREGYLGVVGLPRGGVDIAAAVSPPALASAGGPQAWLREVIARAGGDARAMGERVHGTPLLTRSRERVAHGRVLLVGDACGYVEPFTGEGMTWALQTGASVAAFAQRLAGGSEPGEVARAWSAAHAALTGSRHASCRRVAAAVRSPLRHAAMGLARLAPGVASRLARGVLAGGEGGP